MAQATDLASKDNSLAHTTTHTLILLYIPGYVVNVEFPGQLYAVLRSVFKDILSDLNNLQLQDFRRSDLQAFRF